MAYLYETHMHTSEASACAVSTAAEQVRAYKMRGYAGVIVTDHFVNGNTTVPRQLPWNQRMEMFAGGFAAAKAEGNVCGMDVFFGWEFTIGGLDFLTYGLDMEFLLAHPQMAELDIRAYSALVRQAGGYIAQAHPFREAWYIPHPHPADAASLDGVEVFNATMHASANEKAWAFAETHHLPMQAGSDSHCAELRFSSGISLKKRAESIFDIIAAIRAGDAALLI